MADADEIGGRGDGATPSGLINRAGFVATAITTVCCLGLSAAISLASSVGATFLTRDATLKPLLAVTLGVTVAASAWTFRRHGSPGPLILTVVAGAVIFAALLGPLDTGIGVANASAAHGAHDGGHAMHDAMSAAGGSHGGISARALVWIGLAGLFGAQVWDLLRARRCVAAPPATPASGGPAGVVNA